MVIAVAVSSEKLIFLHKIFSSRNEKKMYRHNMSYIHPRDDSNWVPNFSFGPYRESKYDGHFLRRFALTHPTGSDSLTIEVQFGEPKTSQTFTVSRVPDSQTGNLFSSEELNIPITGNVLIFYFTGATSPPHVFSDDDVGYNHAQQSDAKAPSHKPNEIPAGVCYWLSEIYHNRQEGLTAFIA
jgi:hypothetical protein